MKDSKMKFAEYAKLAKRTLKELPLKEHYVHMALGYAGEMGEIVDAIKKSEIYGKVLDKVNLTEELGDILFYHANLCLSFEHLIAEFDAQLDKLHTFTGKPDIPLSQVVMLANKQFALKACDLAMAEEDWEVQNHASELTFYVLALAVVLDLDVHKAMEANIAKLAKRYGDKYSDYSALNRDTDAERAILEAGTQA